MTRSPLHLRPVSLGIFALVLLCLPCSCRGQDRTPVATQTTPRAKAFRKHLPSEKDLGKRALAEVKTIVGYGPRISGSIARKKAADHLVKSLKAMGYKPIREAFVADVEKIRFENIRCAIPGRSPRVLILGTHYDTKRSLASKPKKAHQVFEGANDGGSGTGLLLALAKDLAKLGKTERPSLELVFFDGEESLDVEWLAAKRALHGSKHFAKKHLKKGHAYGGMVLLDMVGSKKLAIDLDKASTATLVPALREAARALKYDKFFFQKETDVVDDHVPLLEKGLPCLDLIQFEVNPEWHEYEDDLAHLSARSLGIVGRTLWWALPDLEALLLIPAKKK